MRIGLDHCFYGYWRQGWLSLGFFNRCLWHFQLLAKCSIGRSIRFGRWGQHDCLFIWRGDGYYLSFADVLKARQVDRCSS